MTEIPRIFTPIIDNDTGEISSIQMETPMEEIIHDILDGTIPKTYFKDYRLRQINKKVRDYQYRRLVLDLREDIKDICYEDYDDYAMACLNFLQKYKEIHDEWLKIKHAQKIQKDVASLMKSKKPFKP